MKSKVLDILAQALRYSFPHVGPRQAERMALKLLVLREEEFNHLTDSMTQARRRITRCDLCQDLTESKRCKICANPERNHGVVCVVENPQDVEAIEASRSYFGLYHVLHGSLEPKMETGLAGPGGLTLESLWTRLEGDPLIQEVILALDYDTRGELTSLYLTREIKKNFPSLKLTRIGGGLPFGGEVLYMDPATLRQALQARIDLNRQADKAEIGA
ncbi:MAG: recombination protein RecR [Elusimicrobia bacterium]|nr:recombination protein RecR [Elusimicrobiota bacterium]